VITIHGRGLNPLVLDWADFGPPGRAASQVVDYAYLSGTKMQVKAPAQRPTVARARIRLSVKTLAGQSPAARAVYAGVPQVTSVASLASRVRLHGVSGAPDTGGMRIRITGRGFAGQLAGPLEFIVPGGVSEGNEYAYRVVGASTVETTTVAQTPARVDVPACTVTACSAPSRQARLWLYAPGNPAVASLTPASGPPAGGTHTTITGRNLGCPLGVWFGRRPALRWRPGTAVLDCGANEFLRAAAPPGAPGSRVTVSVQTVESYFARHGRGSTVTRFRYGR
jgi:hypothetical protein